LHHLLARSMWYGHAKGRRVGSYVHSAGSTWRLTWQAGFVPQARADALVEPSRGS